MPGALYKPIGEADATIFLVLWADICRQCMLARISNEHESDARLQEQVKYFQVIADEILHLVHEDVREDPFKSAYHRTPGSLVERYYKVGNTVPIHVAVTVEEIG